MKQVEMWKWFKLPVDLQRIVSDDKVDTVSVLKHSLLTTHHVEKMEIAINSCDANQALIAKQAEQIKMLLEEKRVRHDVLSDHVFISHD
ncbi:MAG: hypothetical protein ACRC0J_04355 [Shewanella oncorhynchi]